MFGWTVDKMTIWKSVQKTAQELEFKELKVFVQHKKGGGVRVAGIAIGNYGSGWGKLWISIILGARCKVARLRQLIKEFVNEII